MSALKGRINSISKRLINKSAKIEIRPRHNILRKLEGDYWFFSFDTTHVIAQRLQKDYGVEKTFKFVRTKLGPNGKRLGKELIQMGFSADECSRFINSICIGSFRLSCKYNDLVRLGETKHYSTCMNTQNGVQQLRYLADKDVAVVFVADKSGNFQSRALVRLLRKDGAPILGVYRVYGNGLTRQSIINSELKEKIEIEYLVSKYIGQKTSSWSKHYNPSVLKPKWVDHSYKVEENELFFYISKENQNDLNQVD